MAKVSAIVLSAGKGRRMNSDIAKQYILIGGKPIIYYSIAAFENSDVDEIILVTAPGEEDIVRESIVEKYGFKKISRIVAGGKERYHSVFNGLKAIDDTEYVLIHDGARPMLTPEMISHIIEEVKKTEACVSGVPSKDTIKISDEEGYIDSTPDRSLVWNIHTPQAFGYELIMNAYSGLMQIPDDRIKVTDDAMVVESMSGHKVKLVEGSYKNIKVTTPEDLFLAEKFLIG